MGAQWKAKGKALVADAKGKLFGKLVKEIIVAARAGADPAGNSRLRLAVEAARKASMPKDTLERAISVESSPSRRRKLLVLASFLRIRVSLCWTRGWVMTVTLLMAGACVCLMGRGGPVFSPAGALKMDAAQYQ